MKFSTQKKYIGNARAKAKTPVRYRVRSQFK